MGELFGITLYGLPLLGIVYILSKFMRRHIEYLNYLEAPNRGKIKLKIFFLFLGILYALFCFIGLVLLFLKPPWFKPPLWLMISFIVLIGPYLGCVMGFMGLGEIGHAGQSPVKVASAAIKDIKNREKV